MNDLEHNQNPLAVIVFGGTGDLAKKKLYPALYHLYKNDLLPDDFVIYAFARSEFTDADYQKLVHDSLKEVLDDSEEKSRKEFCSKLKYIQGNLKNVADHEKIETHLKEKGKKLQAPLNRLFYLAVPPRFYKDAFENLDASKIGHETGDYWVRLLVEKPFGSDLKTAQSLDAKLQDIFEERQLFRIDHYLAKTAIQNIIAFRFSNFLFEGSWNNENIKNVHIRMHENFGVEDRGSFYDSVGALRDVGQNHILQMLALTTMDDPGTFDPSAIRDARASALDDLRVYDNEQGVREHSIRAQHDGYKNIEGVAEDSDTETFFQLEAFIDNERWRGVPFYLQSGKELHQNCVEIQVVFKEVLPCVCGAEEPHGHENVVTIRLKPEQKIDVRFWARRPGMEYALSEQHMTFSYDDGNERIPDAYEKILYDSIIGDQTLFARSDEVMSSWEFITPIENHWGSTQLHSYKKGASPADFDFLITH